MSTTKATVAGTVPTGTTGRPSRRGRVLGVLGAAAAALTVWAVAGPPTGVDLRVHMSSGTQHVGPATVVAVSVLTGLAGWAVLAALEHFTPRAQAIWTARALVALAPSLAGPAAAVLAPALIAGRVRR